MSSDRKNESGQLVKELSGKLDWTLLPLEALEGAVAVLEFGATKYSRDSWKQVPASDYRAAAMRHRVARQAGEEFDKESGLRHIDHELCDLIFERWLTVNRRNNG